MVKGKSCIGKDGWNNEIFGLWDCFCWDGITPTPQGNRSTHHFKRDQGRGQPQLFAAQICALRSTGHIYFRSSKRHPGSSGPFFHFDGFLHTAMPHYPSVPWRTEDFFFNCVFGTQHPWAPCKPNKPFKSRPKVNRRNLGPKALPTPTYPAIVSPEQHLTNSPQTPSIQRASGRQTLRWVLWTRWSSRALDICCDMLPCRHGSCGTEYLQGKVSPRSEGGCVTVFLVSFTQRSHEPMNDWVSVWVSNLVFHAFHQGPPTPRLSRMSPGEHHHLRNEEACQNNRI